MQRFRVISISVLAYFTDAQDLAFGFVNEKIMSGMQNLPFNLCS